jgi:hypothetical protein
MRDEPGAAASSPLRAWSSRLVTLLVVALVLGVFVMVQRRTVPRTVGTPATGLVGTLIYATEEGEAWRLWIWDLATASVRPGPAVRSRPLELVWAYVPTDPWLGITALDASGARTAAVLRHLGPADRPVQVASGDLVAWGPSGALVSVVRSVPRGGCRRRLSVETWFIAARTAETRFADVVCGEPVAFGRDQLVPYLTLEHDGRYRTSLVGQGYLRPLVRGHRLVSVSRNSDLLLLNDERDAATLELLRPSPLRPRPVPIGDRAGVPFEALRVLGWSWDGTEAYVLGIQEGVAGIHRIVIGAYRPRPPKLIISTTRLDIEVAPTADGSLFLSADGSVSYVVGAQVLSVAMPAGAPPPNGPLVWVSALP